MHTLIRSTIRICIYESFNSLRKNKLESPSTNYQVGTNLDFCSEVQHIPLGPASRQTWNSTEPSSLRAALPFNLDFPE